MRRHRQGMRGTHTHAAGSRRMSSQHHVHQVTICMAISNIWCCQAHACTCACMAAELHEVTDLTCRCVRQAMWVHGDI